MLGVSASINSEESYAKGERYRERFHSGGTYHATDNPIGRNGRESDHIGTFSLSTHDDNFGVLNALVKRGFINEWDRIHKYINDYDYGNHSVIYNNNEYHIEYFDGCFNPFVVVIININLNNKGGLNDD